ncbi:MAG: winged helix DNA-binding domain-containing protein [Acidimicrobiales bacterium]
MTDAERRARVARRHLLAPELRATAVVDVADSLVALHSSDPATVFLSIAARMHRPSIAAIERALYDGESLVRHHAMRRTLWVLPPDVAAAAHAGFTRKIAAAERRRGAKLVGLDDDAYADAVERAVATVVAADGPTSTRDVAAALPDLTAGTVVNPGKRYETTIAPHTRALLQAAFEGRIVNGRPAGSWISSQCVARWCASPNVAWDRHDEVSGATDIVRRWLDRFGPGTLEDLTWWTGATKTLVRRALDLIEPREVALEGHEDVGYVLADDLDREPGTAPWVALLPGLDPTAMGWKQRGWYLSEDVAARVTDRNGNIGPTVWADGRIVGGWVQRPDGSVAHDADLTASQETLLDAEIDRFRVFVGDTRTRPRFPAPNQAALLG